MAQTTQIVPKFSYPYVETVVNDYTEVSNTNVADAVDSAVKQVYVVTSAKGIDNTWVKKSSKDSAIKTFGDSNFAKYGQPLMQALSVLENDNTECYIMRVMPENATYANSIVSAFYKADGSDIEPSNRKFRIKLEGKSYEGVSTSELNKANLNVDVDIIDAEGFTQVPFMAVRYSGRGVCGNKYSERISQAVAYENEYGIKLYDFEIMNNENGLVKDYDYVGSMVTSMKYNDSTTTQINDLLLDAEIGLPPVDIFVREDRVEEVYDKYVEFIKSLNTDLKTEYAAKVVEYNIPQDQMDGTVRMEDQYVEKYKDLLRIESLIEGSEEDNIPDLDEFDLIFGRRVGTSEMLPNIYFVQELTSDIDTTAEGYVASDYSLDSIIDFSSAKGLEMANGSDGYFAEPRTTYDEEVEACMINAFSGLYDKKILSAKRMPLTIIFDANYPYAVKQTISELVSTRDDVPVRFDAGIINALSGASLTSLIARYASFNNKLESIDINNYETKEESTRKHCVVTINYLLASRFCAHYNTTGYHVPFVKAATQLVGHIKDSLRPVIEDSDTSIKERLYNNRFNYYECVRENVFQRAVQNTRQVKTTDLLEENNVLILCELKKGVEQDLQGQIYNFADDSIRSAFVNFENAKYSNWNSRVVQSIEFSFATSQYEFEHSILHLYVAVTFRGLTKRVIVEIDINKRSYSSTMIDTAAVQ